MSEGVWCGWHVECGTGTSSGDATGRAAAPPMTATGPRITGSACLEVAPRFRGRPSPNLEGAVAADAASAASLEDASELLTGDSTLNAKCPSHIHMLLAVVVEICLLPHKP